MRAFGEERVSPADGLAVAEARAHLSEGEFSPRLDDWIRPRAASAHGLMVGVRGLPQCSGMSPEALVHFGQ
jgi:hypothetical protein